MSGTSASLVARQPCSSTSGLGLIDELNLVVSPILAYAGERLFDNLEGALGNYQVAEQVSTPSGVTHIRVVRA